VLQVQHFYLLEQLRENSQMSWGGRLEQHVDRHASAFMKRVRRHDLREGLHLETDLTQQLLEIDRHGVGQAVKDGHLASL